VAAQYERVVDVSLCFNKKKMLQNMAKVAITERNPSFQASEGWLRKFMHHCSIVLISKTSVAQKLQLYMYQRSRVDKISERMADTPRK
jgi:hypothetical protein